MLTAYAIDAILTAVTDEPEIPDPFTIPLPPGFHPPFPPPGFRGDRVLFIRSEESETSAGKEHEDIMFRRVPREVGDAVPRRRRRPRR